MNRHSIQRQRIGPAVRRMRKAQQLTLDQLADMSDVSPSHLSRLERSQTLPSFPVLAKIADALHVDVNDFVRIEHAVAELDAHLARFADQLALTEETELELTHLSIEARQELVERLKELERFEISPQDIQERMARAIEAGDKDRPFASAVTVIEQSGISPFSLSQLLLVLALLCGERIALIGGPSLLPIFSGQDLYGAFREIFPREPIDPLVTSWWIRHADRTNDGTTDGRWRRVIISEEALASPLGSFIARSMLEARETSPSLEVAVTERPLGGVNFVSVGGEYGLVERLPERPTKRRTRRVAVWLSGQTRIAPGDGIVEGIWATLDMEERDQQSAVARLHEIVAQSG